jgi:hypothetical protein
MTKRKGKYFYRCVNVDVRCLASGEIELYVDDENRRFSEYIDARGDGLTFKRNKLNDADREEMRKFKKRKYISK